MGHTSVGRNLPGFAAPPGAALISTTRLPVPERRMNRFLLAGLVALLPAFAIAGTVPGTAQSAARTAPPAATVLDAYTGRYRLAPGFVLNVYRHGDKLYAQATGQGAAQIYFRSKDHFYYKVVEATITFRRGPHGRVTGLVLHQNGDHPAPRVGTAAGGAPAPAAGTSWLADAAASARARPIAVRRPGFELRGVLDLPAGKGPFPVVDIIPGSGPVDLNGNDSAGPGRGIAYSPYRKLAAALVKAGWAVARIAKRGLPPSTGDGNHVTFHTDVEDDLAVVKALRANPHVDPRRIVLLGHSLGGLIAPRLATLTRVYGLVLLEAPGERMTRITTDQVLAANRAAGASATQIEAVTQAQDNFYKRVARAKPGQSIDSGGNHVPAWEVRLLKSLYARDPLATAKKVRVPALVIQGGRDFSVQPGNGKRLVKALPQATLLVLPRMGHALDAASCQCARQLDTGPDAELDAGLVPGIVRWLKTLGR